MNYRFCTKTGNANWVIDVYFDVSMDGDIDNLLILNEARPVTGLLSEGQIEEIESEAWAHYERECKEHNDDLKINNYLAGAGL